MSNTLLLRGIAMFRKLTLGICLVAGTLFTVGATEAKAQRGYGSYYGRSSCPTPFGGPNYYRSGFSPYSRGYSSYYRGVPGVYVAPRLSYPSYRSPYQRSFYGGYGNLGYPGIRTQPFPRAQLRIGF